MGLIIVGMIQVGQLIFFLPSPPGPLLLNVSLRTLKPNQRCSSSEGSAIFMFFLLRNSALETLSAWSVEPKIMQSLSSVFRRQPTAYITLHYITLHYITLHYITLHYITLHYVALRYLTYIHKYIDIFFRDPDLQQYTHYSM